MAERVSLALNTTTTTMASSLRTQVSASRLLRFSSSGSKLSFPSSSLSFTRSLVSSPLLSQVPSQFFISLFLYPIWVSSNPDLRRDVKLRWWIGASARLQPPTAQQLRILNSWRVLEKTSKSSSTPSFATQFLFVWDGMMLAPTTRTSLSGLREVELMAVSDTRLSLSTLLMLVIYTCFFLLSLSLFNHMFVVAFRSCKCFKPD